MRVDAATAGRIVPGVQPSAVSSGKEAGASFGEALQKSIEQVNQLQVDADAVAGKVAAGDLGSVQQAMVAMEKASLALDLTVQVRNKVIEAYQELMRTQA